MRVNDQLVAVTLAGKERMDPAARGVGHIWVRA